MIYARETSDHDPSPDDPGGGIIDRRIPLRLR
jgi:hypothetical protein